MIETKVFELRDKDTFIPIIASLMRSEQDREAWLLWRAGYSASSPPLVLLTRLNGGKATYDYYDWGGRTYPVAHKWIVEHWDALASGELIDVRVILGERPAPCETEQAI